MHKVYCDSCGKFLFETDKDNRGGIASEARQRGYVAKLPLFYGTPEFKIFCDKECKENWWDENVTPEQKKEGDLESQKLKEELFSPKFIGGLQEGISRIQNLFNQTKKKR